MSIHKLLNKLLKNHQDRLDRFNISYIEDFHHVLREQFDINNISDKHNTDFVNLLGQISGTFNRVQELIPSLMSLVSVSDFLPLTMPKHIETRFRYTEIPNWKDIKDTKDINTINLLQKNYSSRVKSRGKLTVSHFWGRKETGDIWGKFIPTLNLKSSSKVLTIGPRHCDEILYFRNKLTLPETIGLDLFSQNTKLVKIGDMHDMPFEDNSFELVYQKNTFNKAYNLRLVLNECYRILKPNGILISDDCTDYIHGVSPISRSNVTNINWYLKYFKDKVKDVMFDKEYSIKSDWIRKVGLIALRINK